MHITDCLANSNFAEVEEPLPEMPKAEPAPKKDMFNWKPASVPPAAPCQNQTDKLDGWMYISANAYTGVRTWRVLF